MFNDEPTKDFFNDIVSMALKRPNLRDALEKDPVEVFRQLGFKLKKELKFVFYEEVPLAREPDVVYINIGESDEVDLSLDDLAYVNGGSGTVQQDLMGFGPGTKPIELAEGAINPDFPRLLNEAYP